MRGKHRTALSLTIFAAPDYVPSSLNSRFAYHYEGSERPPVLKLAADMFRPTGRNGEVITRQPRGAARQWGYFPCKGCGARMVSPFPVGAGVIVETRGLPQQMPHPALAAGRAHAVIGYPRDSRQPEKQRCWACGHYDMYRVTELHFLGDSELPPALLKQLNDNFAFIQTELQGVGTAALGRPWTARLAGPARLVRRILSFRLLRRTLRRQPTYCVLWGPRERPSG